MAKEKKKLCARSEKQANVTAGHSHGVRFLRLKTVFVPLQFGPLLKEYHLGLCSKLIKTW